MHILICDNTQPEVLEGLQTSRLAQLPCSNKHCTLRSWTGHHFVFSTGRSLRCEPCCMVCIRLCHTCHCTYIAAASTSGLALSQYDCWQLQLPFTCLSLAACVCARSTDSHGMQELHGLNKSCRPCKRLCSSTAKRTGQSDGLQLQRDCLAALTRMSSDSTPMFLHGEPCHTKSMISVSLHFWELCLPRVLPPRCISTDVCDIYKEAWLWYDLL